MAHEPVTEKAMVFLLDVLIYVEEQRIDRIVYSRH